MLSNAITVYSRGGITRVFEIITYNSELILFSNSSVDLWYSSCCKAILKRVKNFTLSKNHSERKILQNPVSRSRHQENLFLVLNTKSREYRVRLIPLNI